MKKYIEKYKKDLFFVLTLLVLGGMFFLIFSLGKTHGNLVQVRVDGRVYATYSLMDDCTYTIEGISGLDTIEIKGNRVRMIDAECPDHLCINMGWIDSTGESIVCLPNRIVVEILRDEQEIDVKVR